MRLALVVVLLISPCACRSDGPKTHGAGAPVKSTGEPPVAEPPAPDGVLATAQLARCGWGTVSSEPGATAPPWAIALMDVDVKRSAKGLRVISFELADDTGTVAMMGPRSTLRIQEGATQFSFGAANTREVLPVETVGAFRLRAAAALDRPRAAIVSRKPARCDVVLSDDEGAHIVASGALDPEWENE